MKLAKKTAGNKDLVKRPHSWDKAVSVAYLRLLGASQEQAAIQVGCAERSIRDWEKCSWWPHAVMEAQQRWLQGGDQAARRGLIKAMTDPKEYAVMARWWAERRIPELANKGKLELTGEDGGPVRVLHDVDDEAIERRIQQLLNIRRLQDGKS